MEGVIEMVPPQDHLMLDIRRCYICAGRDGHVPKFNPSNKEFGCLMDSPELHFTMKLIVRLHEPISWLIRSYSFIVYRIFLYHCTQDKDDGLSVQKAFYNQLFNATFTQLGCSSNKEATETKNCDAFMFDITPLFNVSQKPGRSLARFAANQ